MPLTKPTTFTWGGTQSAPTSGEQASGYGDTQKPTNAVFNWVFAQLALAATWINNVTGSDLAVSGSDPTKIDAAITANTTALGTKMDKAGGTFTGVIGGTTPSGIGSATAAGKFIPADAGGKFPAAAIPGNPPTVTGGGTKLQSGKFTHPGGGDAVFVFPVAFSATPVLTPCLEIAGDATGSFAQITAISSTGCSIVLRTHAGALPGGTVHWIAMGT